MKLFQAADRYCKESNWKIPRCCKICLVSFGSIIGILVSKEKKKAVFGAGFAALRVTYPPLMGKYFRIWQEE